MPVCVCPLRVVLCSAGRQTGSKLFYVPCAPGIVADRRAPAGSCFTDLTLAMG